MPVTVELMRYRNETLKLNKSYIINKCEVKMAGYWLYIHVA